MALISVGVVVILSGGTASPLVAAVGTGIGEMMGLSGVAATNAGLALLGGGSIASGGFGVIGGTVLLSAALSFSGDVALDYARGKIASEYEYNKLIEYSKKMLTLPIPVNESGPDGYQDAMDLVKIINKEMPIYSNGNQEKINRAIEILENDFDATDADEKTREYALLSWLYFVSNKYIEAKKAADAAIYYARKEDVRRTFPAFIYAVSSLYEKEFDYKLITKNYFRYSILAEPDNPLIPLLFSIYLDRMSLRFNDGFLNEKSLNLIFEIMQSPSIAEYRFANYNILLSRYFMLIKLNQQKLLSLAETTNETIKNSPKTLQVVEDAFQKYERLIEDANIVLMRLSSIDPDDGNRGEVEKFSTLLDDYRKDSNRLSGIVNNLRKYQNRLSEKTQIVTENKKSNWIVYALLVIVALFTFFLIRKYMKRK